MMGRGMFPTGTNGTCGEGTATAASCCSGAGTLFSGVAWQAGVASSGCTSDDGGDAPGGALGGGGIPAGGGRTPIAGCIGPGCIGPDDIGLGCIGTPLGGTPIPGGPKAGRIMGRTPISGSNPRGIGMTIDERDPPIIPPIGPPIIGLAP